MSEKDGRLEVQRREGGKQSEKGEIAAERREETGRRRGGGEDKKKQTRVRERFKPAEWRSGAAIRRSRERTSADQTRGKGCEGERRGERGWASIFNLGLDKRTPVFCHCRCV